MNVGLNTNYTRNLLKLPYIHVTQLTEITLLTHNLHTIHTYPQANLIWPRSACVLLKEQAVTLPALCSLSSLRVAPYIHAHCTVYKALALCSFYLYSNDVICTHSGSERDGAMKKEVDFHMLA